MVTWRDVIWMFVGAGIIVLVEAAGFGVWMFVGGLRAVNKNDASKETSS